jgi:hypothetical protein
MLSMVFNRHPGPENQKLDANLVSLGFQRCPSDPAIYCRGEKNGSRLILRVYVDDLLITGSSELEIQKFKKHMEKLFKMSDLGVLHYYLDIEVKKRDEGLILTQSNYALKILEKAGMEGCNPCRIPMEPKLKLSKESSSHLVDATFYRSVMGSLRYFVNISPDITFVVGYVSRFMQEPHSDHLAAVKHILRYVAGTCEWGLFYARGNGEEPTLRGFSDSDLAGDIDGRKSTTGLIFFIDNSHVCWQSTQQRIVAMSSCEAEYIAAATASCQAIWPTRLLYEMLGRGIRRPALNVDNKSAISIIKNPVLNDRSKHIDTWFYLIKEYEANGQISVKFIRIEEQLGDILTKAIDKIKFKELCNKLGLHKPSG